MGHGGDVLKELTADHQEVEELFDRIQSLPAGDERRRDLLDSATIELVRHSVAEEQYLYPAVREYLEDGHRVADKELADHADIEGLLRELEHRGPQEAEFDHLIGRLVHAVDIHVRDEENRLFPALREVCSAEELAGLGERLREARKAAPTRPHPSAPDVPAGDRPPAGEGMVDRARDMLTGRGR